MEPFVSEAGRRFQRSLKAPENREFTYDLASLRELSGAERERAVALLSELASTTGDDRAAETLGFMEGDEIVGLLQPLAEGVPSTMRSAARRSLVRLVGDPPSLARLRQDMDEDPWPISTGLSVALLREVDGPVDTLLAALRNASFLARVHAVEGLIEHFALEDFRDFHGPLQCWCTLQLCTLPSAFLEGAERLEQMVDALQQGRPAESLELIHRPGTRSELLPMVVDILNGRDEYDLSVLGELDGQDAAWLRVQLVLRLSQDGDPRAVRAMVALEIDGWRRFLSEQAALEERKAGGGPPTPMGDLLQLLLEAD